MRSYKIVPITKQYPKHGSNLYLDNRPFYILKFIDMKTFIPGLSGAVVLVLLLFAFKPHTETGTIKGRISPADGATQVWAITGADTLKTVPVNGEFVFDKAETGTYTVAVDAKDPYKDQMIENVEVKAGEIRDLGEIKLLQ
jgi:hypothetical protein